MQIVMGSLREQKNKIYLKISELRNRIQWRKPDALKRKRTNDCRSQTTEFSPVQFLLCASRGDHRDSRNQQTTEFFLEQQDY